MFHTANQADLCVADHNGAGGVVQCLHGRTAQTVNRGRRDAVWDFRQQRRIAGNVESLFQRLLHAAPVNIINIFGVQRRISGQHGAHQMRGEIFSPDVAKCAAL